LNSRRAISPSSRCASVFVPNGEAVLVCDFDGELKDLGPVPETLLTPLERKLEEDPGLWLRADPNKPNRFEAFKGSTLHIVFQFPADLRSHTQSTYGPLWTEWQPLLDPLIAHAATPYQYRHGRTARIMLARLLAGKEIARHVDNSPSAELPHKIHIPLITNAAVRFLIGEGDYFLPRGRAYEVNNRKPHAVRNPSASDRVHLIFDYFNGA
jgi:hypothetical protein